MIPRTTCWKPLTVAMATANCDGGPCISLYFIAVAGKWLRVLAVTQALSNGTQWQAVRNDNIILYIYPVFYNLCKETKCKSSGRHGEQKHRDRQTTRCVPADVSLMSKISSLLIFFFFCKKQKINSLHFRNWAASYFMTYNLWLITYSLSLSVFM